MKRLLLLLPLFFMISFFISSDAFAQKTWVTGKITDKSNKDPLIGANVVIKGTTTGVATDVTGTFKIEVDLSAPVTLQISFIGYGNTEYVVSPGKTNINISMEVLFVPGTEVVVTGSRVSETLMQSPVSIQKMSEKEIKEVASGDFYEGLSSVQGVDISTSSMGFKAVNMRGFNSTSPVRVVQFIDGMDNQAPGLNFPVGNLVGANELDLQSIEIITGAASALYGPNAFQGVISMKTKNPFDYEGLSVQLKGGSRSMADMQLRYAKVIDKKKRLAVKVTGGFFRALDWEAVDTGANKYGDISSVQNLSAIVEKLQYDPEKTQEDRDKFIALNNYLSFNPVTYQGLGKREITAPGYMEADVVDYTTKSLKLGAELHYKIKDSLTISYTYKYGLGTAVYQGTNRYSINNIRFQQHKVELNGKRFTIRAYNTLENAGDSYDAVFTAINISKAGIKNYISEYLGAYFDTLKILTGDFKNDAKNWMVTQATSHATSVANKNAWYQPGEFMFDSLKNAIRGNANLQSGSKFTDISNLQHVEGQYNFNWSFLDVLAGGSFRRYDPQSYGTIFEDTLVNRADTMFDGSADLKAKFVNISQVEFGGFVQVSRDIVKDKLKIIASGRIDKNQNFDPQVSPRLSLVSTIKNHVFRLSAQSAFRSPTLQNQYILLDLGPISLIGNLNGVNNLYTLDSQKEFKAMYDSVDANGLYVGKIDPSLLKTIKLDPLRPEQVKTVEAGYRGIYKNKFFVDLSVYLNMYSHFIGNIRVVQPKGGAVAGEESGVDAILTNTPDNKTFNVYQVAVNAKQNVRSYGASLGLAYYLNNKYSITTNYTYSQLDDKDLTDPILPGFNTAPHKVNVGLRGRRVVKNFGFNTTFQWVDAFQWQSSFGDGPVSSYSVLDMQLNYEFPGYYSTVRVGSSNLINKQRVEIYGGPTIGRLFYVSWLFDIK